MLWWCNFHTIYIMTRILGPRLWKAEEPNEYKISIKVGGASSNTSYIYISAGSLADGRLIQSLVEGIPSTGKQLNNWKKLK
jgi:hypothetical protein